MLSFYSKLARILDSIHKYYTSNAVSFRSVDEGAVFSENLRVQENSLVFLTLYHAQHSQPGLCLGIRITSLPRNDPKSRPVLGKHLPEIGHKLLRLLVRSEMATAVMLRFEYQIRRFQPPVDDAKDNVSSHSLINPVRRIRRG